MTSKKLVNQTQMPSIGFGTWRLDTSYDTELIIGEALKQGYRHFDTAAFYQNEVSIGRAITLSNIPRETIFLTSKVPSHIKDPQKTKEIFEQTLKDLQTDYVDLYLIHGPAPKEERHQSHLYHEGNVLVWRALEELYLEGKTRAIGISNFSLEDLKTIREHASILPMVHQIPFYVGLDQKVFLDDANLHHMIIQAYSPLAKGALINHPNVILLAKKYGKTAAQILLQYCLAMDTVPLPKTQHPTRMKENLEVFFELEEADIEWLKMMRV